MVSDVDQGSMGCRECTLGIAIIKSPEYVVKSFDRLAYGSCSCAYGCLANHSRVYTYVQWGDTGIALFK